jgi:beta-catenin-like protein 1
MNGNAEGDSSQVKDVISRLAMGVAASSNSCVDFIPSLTFQGGKAGYYFGTSAKGTGYYIDEYQRSKEKKRKRSVRIAEEHNETKLLPSTLLEQAEKRAAGSTVIELTPKGIQSASNALTKIMNQNAMQRARFPNEPQQYMNSELSLYEQLTALQAVAANAQLYQHLVDNGVLISTLTELLGHENADVSAVTVALLLEWIDPTLLLEGDSDITSEMGTLAGRILREAWETIVSNLSLFQSSQQKRQDDTQDQTLKGIDNSLSLMENLLELDLLIPDGLLGEDSKLSAAAYMVEGTQVVPWLFQLISDEQANDELKGRSIELLSFLAQKEDVFSVLPDWSQLSSHSSNIIEDEDEQRSNKKEKLQPINGIEILLLSIGAYRKKQPANDQEVEFLENTCGTNH